MIDLFSEFPVVEDAAARGFASFSHLSEVSEVAVLRVLMLRTCEGLSC
jgi:hypothetical protein